MLDDLDEIDWASLSHAWGAAANTPELLRRVAGGGSDGRGAIGELFNTIWHQGTIYDATAPAVPFLGEIAVSESVDVLDRKLVLALIFAIGRGTGYWQVHGQCEQNVPDDVAQLLQDEEVAVRNAHSAVAQLARRFLDSLETFPRTLRLSVAVLVAVAGDLPSSIAPRIGSLAVTLPPFGRLGLETLMELSERGGVVDGRELAALDGDLDDYAEQSQEFQITIGSYFVDVLAERLCDTDGEGA